MSIEYIVYSEEDKTWVISAGWCIVMADRKISIAYRVKKEKENKLRGSRERI